MPITPPMAPAAPTARLSSPRRRTAYGAALLTAAAALPMAVSSPAYAAPCSNPSSPTCFLGVGGGGNGGGGGTGGGGGGGGTGQIPTLDGVGQGGRGTQTAPPAAAPPATVDLAEEARTTATLPTPTAHTSPSGKTYVRVNTRLWVDGFVTVKTEPITVGAQTVQAIATPKSVTWNLGETTLTCNEPGSKNTQECSYTYRRSSAKQQGGTYKITATITWGVTWTCTGAECDAPGGTLTDATMPSLQTPLTVGEIQSNTK